MTDYYSVLRRAVVALDPNTPQARRDLYDRARRMLTSQFLNDGTRFFKIDAETAAFEAAVERIEAAMDASGSVDWGRLHKQSRTSPEHEEPVPGCKVSRPRHPRLFPALLSCLGIVAALSIMVASYQFLTKPTTFRSGAGNDRTADSSRLALSTDSDEELEPGVDGGSTADGLPYFFRRQLVYYRTVYSVGMILVDRSQRFLYLVQPKITALRYGIGVGGECSGLVGLRRVTQKFEWPEWVPSADLIKRRSYPARMPGGVGNPLGARSLALDGSVLGIHGTNAPKSIGHLLSLGCFRMVNDDIIDLYQRVSTGAAVVVMN